MAKRRNAADNPINKDDPTRQAMKDLIKEILLEMSQESKKDVAPQDNNSSTKEKQNLPVTKSASYIGSVKNTWNDDLNLNAADLSFDKKVKKVKTNRSRKPVETVSPTIDVKCSKCSKNFLMDRLEYNLKSSLKDFQVEFMCSSCKRNSI